MDLPRVWKSAERQQVPANTTLLEAKLGHDRSFRVGLRLQHLLVTAAVEVTQAMSVQLHIFEGGGRGLQHVRRFWACTQSIRSRRATACRLRHSDHWQRTKL